MATTRRIIFTVIIAILLASLLAGMVVIFVTNEIKTRELLEKETQFRMQTQSLEIEKAKLWERYAGVEEKIKDKIACGANVSLIFLEVDRTLYDSIYPIIGKQSVLETGVMCFSPEELPGQEGNITLDECSEMLKFGWTTAIYWKGEGELSEYLTQMRESLTALGIEMPKTVVFAINKYATAHDDTLKSFGIKHAVHHGEEKLPIVDTSIDTDDLLRPGSIGWLDANGQRLFISKIYEKKGCAAMILSFNMRAGDDIRLNVADSGNYSTFINMMTFLSQTAAAKEVSVNGFEQAWENRVNYEMGMSTYEDDVIAEKLRISGEISEINRQLKELYYTYY